MLEIFVAFLRLGLLSFGGPVAHLGYLHAEFVDKRRWLDDAHFADLVALCQLLPGPASSQLVFALGMHRAGIAGALCASLCFTLPSAALMIGFAYGIAGVDDLADAGWLQGLKVVAVAVVAQAVWLMGRKLCPDRVRRALCLAAAAVLIAAPGAFAQIAVIAVGALVGQLIAGAPTTTTVLEIAAPSRRAEVFAVSALVLFAILLVLLPALSSLTNNKDVAVFAGFYRAGSLVFGGGHVVLPLLRAEIVPHGWLSDAQFLAGYGAAQAVPGPLFTFAAYLGAAMAPGPNAWLHGLWCLLAVFLPAWLLIGGALPLWHRLRIKPRARGALAGANASVVGVLLAALYSPVITEGVRGPRDVVVALAAFALLEVGKVSAWWVVLGAAAIGALVL